MEFRPATPAWVYRFRAHARQAEGARIPEEPGGGSALGVAGDERAYRGCVEVSHGIECARSNVAGENRIAVAAVIERGKPYTGLEEEISGSLPAADDCIRPSGHRGGVVLAASRRADRRCHRPRYGDGRRTSPDRSRCLARRGCRHRLRGWSSRCRDRTTSGRGRYRPG